VRRAAAGGDGPLRYPPDLIRRIRGAHTDVRMTFRGPEDGPQVLLVPGLGATRRIFEINDRQTLPDLLLERGFRVLAVEFRTHWRDRHQSLASLMEVLHAATADLGPLDLVGHSLGGMLALGLAAEGLPIQRIVTMGSGLDYRGGPSTFAPALGLIPFARRAGLTRGLPVKRAARTLAALGGGPTLLGRRDQFHPGNTSLHSQRRAYGEAIGDIPLPLLLDLGGLFSDPGLLLPDGRSLRDASAQLPQPVLAIGGRHDRQCPVAAVEHLADLVPDGRALIVGDDAVGYGHIDMLTAAHAVHAVFATAADFLLLRSPGATA